VVVFFNTYVWLMASTISRTRLWIALLFLLVVKTAFLVSATASRVTPMLESLSAPTKTRMTSAARPSQRYRIRRSMSRRPARNASTSSSCWPLRIAHLLMVAICTASIYFALGLIVLSPAILAKWTGDGASDGTILGMTIPVPQSLIHMALILCALTFMYVSARSVGDDEYKRDFLTPLIEDLHTPLIARNRYRNEPANAR
jgi:hypothetical protein